MAKASPEELSIVLGPLDEKDRRDIADSLRAISNSLAGKTEKEK